MCPHAPARPVVAAGGSIVIGTPELVVGGILILVLFGAKRIPELARSVGQAVGELQKGIRESQRVVREAAEEEPEQTTTRE